MADAVPPEMDLQPDRAQILACLRRMTHRWDTLGVPVWFEIRLIRPGGSILPQKYRPDEDGITLAADCIMDANRDGRNAYAVRNPIRDDCGGSASDGDIIAAFAAFADCDDEQAAANLWSFVGPKYTYGVTTGTVPCPRPHPYWEFTDPVTDMMAWTDLQKRIAASLGSDPTVVNPSRIMRIAGTITWPDAKKQARGYVQELATIRTDYNDAAERQPVPFERLQRAFGQAAPAAVEAPVSALDINTGPKPLDREGAAQSVLSGEEWHNNIIRLVASYVSKGLTDAEIHGLTDHMTLPGYSVDQTRAEVQKAIDGARSKGWAPEPAPELRTEPATTPPQADEAPAPVKIPFIPWAEIDLEQIPRTRFVYNGFYARGYTSLTIAAPKVGKSMLALTEAIDMATGFGSLSGAENESLRVIYFNAEDDQDVINNRVAAALKHYSIDQDAIAGKLFATSGVDWEGFYLSYGENGEINEALFQALEASIRENEIDVLMMDPLQDMTSAPETNDAFRALGRRLRRLASDTDIAIGVVHHTRKIAPGVAPSVDDARGGSALRGTSRFNRVLAQMSEDEAEKAGLDNHRWYLRTADIESNLAPPSADINQWFRKVSVTAPNGESVGVIEKWKWPDAFEGVQKEDAIKIREIIDRMETPPRLDIRSKAWAGEIICDALGLNPSEKRDRSRAQQILKAWVEADVLRVAEQRDSRNGRDVQIVVCGGNNPMVEPA